MYENCNFSVYDSFHQKTYLVAIWFLAVFDVALACLVPGTAFAAALACILPTHAINV